MQASSSVLHGTVCVPGSKSHTIRALIFASLAEGVSFITNPLPSADALSCVHALQEFGAQVSIEDSIWSVCGAGKNFHLPSNVVDVGNSGSVLYFLTPLAATLEGYTVFTGDASIRTRPVRAMLDALAQCGVQAFTTRPSIDAPPLVVKGVLKAGRIVTKGHLSQYISGILMAASRCSGTFSLELTDPKETPYIQMTIDWLASFGIPAEYTTDYTKIRITGPHTYAAFNRTIPSDWEAVAFPLVASLITDSEITICNIDYSGSQGDEAIVDTVRKMGGNLIENKVEKTLTVCAGNTKNLHGIVVNCAGIPDAVPALAVLACFAEGTTILEDISVCRLKETDRISLMRTELTKLGASVEETADSLIIHGISKHNSSFALHGGVVESYDDHRIAMSLAVMGLGLADGNVTVHNAECCAVSFPHFFDVMTTIGANFRSVN